MTYSFCHLLPLSTSLKTNKQINKSGNISVLKHTLRSYISQETALSLVTQMLQQLLSLESRRRKICGGSWWNEHGLGEEQDLKFLTVSSWDQSIACWASMIRCLSVEITVWEPFRSWRKVTPSKGPRHGIWVNRRHCKFRLSPHVFCFPGLLHHCYHCSDFSSSIVSIWRLDNFFTCLVKGLSMLKNSRSTRIECQHSLFFSSLDLLSLKRGILS